MYNQSNVFLHCGKIISNERENILLFGITLLSLDKSQIQIIKNVFNTFTVFISNIIYK